MRATRRLLTCVFRPAAHRWALVERNLAVKNQQGTARRWLSTWPQRDDAGMTSTHFGFAEVPVDEKTAKVKDVFYEVAERYDVMNDLMSGGMHRCYGHL